MKLYQQHLDAGVKSGIDPRRGPEAAKAYIEDDYIFVVLEGGMTRNEETLLAAGKADLVRQYRLTFQDVVGPTATGAVEELTGRKVIGYHSQVVFEPFRAFEIFVLEPSTNGLSANGRRLAEDG